MDFLDFLNGDMIFPIGLLIAIAALLIRRFREIKKYRK